MSFPRSDEEGKAFLSSVLPDDPRIQLRPMFGNQAVFVNGNMFAGLFGKQMFVRLPEAERLWLMEQEGATEFSPMPGKAMKEYIVIPETWRQEPDKVRDWIGQSLAWIGAMPEKSPAKKPSPKKAKKEK
jgi:TfoX/Sxy family transcriptional regulator of competence genes